jgi:chromate transporter
MIALLFGFMLLGLITFGGGLVAIPLMMNLVMTRGWLTLQEFYQWVAIAESTPGPIAINLATLIGFNQFGILGGVLATLAFVIPSFVIISLILPLFTKMSRFPKVKLWLLMMKAGMIGMIGYTVFSLIETNYNNIADKLFPSVVFIVSLIGLIKPLRKYPQAWIALGALFGLIFL